MPYQKVVVMLLIYIPLNRYIKKKKFVLNLIGIQCVVVSNTDVGLLHFKVIDC